LATACTARALLANPGREQAAFAKFDNCASLTFVRGAAFGKVGSFKPLAAHGLGVRIVALSE